METGMESNGDWKDGPDDLTSINSKLFNAIQCNSIEDTRFCVNTLKADVNSRDLQGNTPLHIAVDNCFGAIVRFLVLNGAEINAENSSKCTAVDIARSKELYDIVNLLTSVESTNWYPGGDPALLLLPRDNEYSEPKAKESLIYERSQISLLLEEAGLKHYFPNFESNNITYIRFLRMDDECLAQIGIPNSEDRKKILDIIKSLSERKWQPDSVLPNFMQRDLSSSELACMLKNLDVHTQTLTSGVNHVREQITRSPDMLRHNMEMVTIGNLYSAIENVSDVTKVLMNSIGTLSTAFSSIQALPSKSCSDNSKVLVKSSRTFLHACGIGLLSLAGSGLLGSYFYNRLRR